MSTTASPSATPSVTPERNPEPGKAALRKVRLDVGGMHCAGCVARVEALLGSQPQVASASVNLALERAEVQVSGDGTDEALAAVLTDAGFPSQLRGDERARELQALAVDIDGMSCAACVGRVERALEAVPGVVSAQVNLALGNALVGVERPGLEDAVLAAATAAGYPAHLRRSAAAPEAPARDRELAWLLFAAVLTLPLVVQMGMMVAGSGWRLPPLLELVLAAPVQFLAGARFYRGAWNSLRHGAASMDVLVALGTSAAFCYSLAVVLGATRGHLYFEASAVIITLVLLGKWLEARARRGASAALRELMALRPDTATVERDGVEQAVAADRVVPGDVVVVRPGARIPVDGTILSGDTEVDESLITGESLPVARSAGDAVIGGAVNGSGLLRVRIVALVEEAQMRKAPVQRLVDRISARFVPAVVAVAVLTFTGWWLAAAGLEQSLVAAVAVLVIACPCALGLATPTALVAGTGASARAGILRDIEALERAAAIDMVIFDKTGTLTAGRPRLTQIAVGEGDAPALLRLAASVQHGSEHPLARAAVERASDEGLSLAPVTEFRNHPGAGVTARADGHRVAVGSRALLAKLDVDCAPLDALLDGMESDAATWSAVAVDGRIAGVLAYEDELRSDAPQALAGLAARGVQAMLLTGDNEASAARVAKRAGIERWQSAATPETKAARVTELTRDGHRVAMVGDGINDAPALAAADLGIAMGGGTDVAMETAGITLMRHDLGLVAGALDVSRRTLRTIRQNLFWAFVYNVVGIPVAAMGLLDPALAGAAMAMSSVCVVTNSLRLRRWRPRPENAT
jgi:Cu+-exporting ATPase